MQKTDLVKGQLVHWNGNPSVEGGPSYRAGVYPVIDLFARKSYDQPDRVGLGYTKGLGVGAKLIDLTPVKD